MRKYWKQCTLLCCGVALAGTAFWQIGNRKKPEIRKYSAFFSVLGQEIDEDNEDVYTRQDKNMLRVLLVDDEPFIVQGLMVFVDWEQEGYEIVYTAADGAEALTSLKEHKAVSYTHLFL